jgi:hypothetical protein
MALSAGRQFLLADALGQMLKLGFGGIVLVAVVAGVLGVRANVAGDTINVALPAVIQWKGVLQQLCRLPGLGGVAVGAVYAKQAGMNGRFGVAPHTIAGRAAEHFVNVAGSAFLGGVLPTQWPNLVVIKIGHFAVAVMAAQAILAKLGDVPGHKFRGLRLVALDALRLAKADRLRGSVTSAAGERRAIEIGYVGQQAKTGVSAVFKWNRLQ